MGFQIQADAPPLRVDEHGVCRGSGTRVTLEVILGAYLRGESPEEIADSYPSVPLSDVYATIGYYLRHRAEVDA
jgi:uncharacterized protein (DUF433 family)